MDQIRVVGISAVSGGGKTSATKRLVEALGDAVALHFDDYDDTNVHPDDLQRWFADGADYDVFQTPVFSRHLQALKSGQSISHPVEGKSIAPSRFVVADAPLGRVHADSGRFIDLMVFVDTPLDVAMARRILRDIELADSSMADDTLERLKAEASGHVGWFRPIHEYFQERMRASSDLIVDGTLSVDVIVERILSKMRAVWGEERSPGQ